MKQHFFKNEYQNTDVKNSAQLFHLILSQDLIMQY